MFVTVYGHINSEWQEAADETRGTRDKGRARPITRAAEDDAKLSAELH